MPTSHLTRRNFLKTTALAATPFILRWDLRGAPAEPRKLLRFGICADVHQDVMHDGEARMRVFIDRMKKEKPDFIFQLGDFCQPRDTNKKFLSIWNEFPGPRYHMLGNHDKDGGFSWKQVMAFWDMEKRYYSFDRDGWHFIVLDGNEKSPVKKIPGYPRYIGAEQLAWLADDLKKTKLPTILSCHQSLESDDNSIDNREEVRALLEKTNAEAGWTKVGVCLSGHHHIDFQRTINGITYVQVNSMSCSWLGDKYTHVRYGAEVDKTHPYIKYTAPYKDPLFSLATLDPAGVFKLEGTTSEFVGPSPWDLGMPDKKDTDRCRERLVPKISDRKIPLKVRPA